MRRTVGTLMAGLEGPGMRSAGRADGELASLSSSFLPPKTLENRPMSAQCF